jgi:hypothetical protein
MRRVYMDTATRTFLEKNHGCAIRSIKLRDVELTAAIDAIFDVIAELRIQRHYEEADRKEHVLDALKTLKSHFGEIDRETGVKL